MVVETMRRDRMSLRRAGWWCLVAAAVPLLLTAVDAQRCSAETIDRVVASIDGEPVTQSELETYARGRGAGDAPSSEALNAYVMDTLLRKEAEAAGINITDESVDRYIATVKAQRGMNDAAFETALREQGISGEQYREDIRSEIIKAELVNREIRSRVSIPPEDIRRHYEAHRDAYTLAERVRIRMIMIPIPPDAPPALAGRAETMIQVLHARIQAGEDFAQLARQYSAGPGASDGGDLGFFERGQMVKPLEYVAFRMKAGEVSEPIRSGGGLHLIKVEEREGAVEEPLEAVEDQIREVLYQQAVERRYEKWLREDLRAGHHVEILM
jgi:peptidyl-prolyl cis-trans isomerase SurA